MSVYLKLFHGRRALGEQMDDWGEPGPILGPLPYVHTTYGGDIQCGKMVHLTVVDDCVFYGGWYYGDWSVTTIDRLDEQEQGAITAPVPELAEVPGKAVADGAV